MSILRLTSGEVAVTRFELPAAGDESAGLGLALRPSPCVVAVVIVDATGVKDVAGVLGVMDSCASCEAGDTASPVILVLPFVMGVRLSDHVATEH